MKKFLKSIMMLTVAVVGASLAFAFAGCEKAAPSVSKAPKASNTNSAKTAPIT